MSLTPDVLSVRRGETRTKTDPCPKSVHFHAFATDVFEVADYSFLVECQTPNEALDAVVAWLPPDWEGSIEIDSDKTNSTRKESLLDFWRTPLRE